MGSLAFFLAIYLYPLTRLLVWSFFSPGFTLAHYAKLFGEPGYMQALRNTAEISVWVTVLSLALGYPLAYLMTVVSGRVRTLLIVLVLVPFWTSVLVRTFAWIVRCRRLNHDYERLPEHSDAMIKWAMIGLMTRRISPTPGRRPWQPSIAH